MCYDDKNKIIDEAVGSIFGARIMLQFGIGSHSLDQCQNFPTCLREQKYEAISGKAVFQSAFKCNDQWYDLVLNLQAITNIAQRFSQAKMIKRNRPEIIVPTGRCVLDPAYVKPSVSA